MNDLCTAAADFVSQPTASIARTTSASVNDANYSIDADAVSNSPVHEAHRTDDNDGDSEEEDATSEANAAAAGCSDDGDDDKAPAEAESVDDNY